MIHVLLADDEALVRAGLRTILESDPDITVVAEAGDGRTALDLATTHRPDVVLLDVRMPGPTGGDDDGLDAVLALRQRSPSVAVIVLTTFDSGDNVARAVHGGANGFLLKAADPRELLAAVHATAAGEGFLSPRVTGRVLRLASGEHDTVGVRGADAERKRDEERVGTLTARERDVLGLLAQGLSNREIGQELFLSEGTIKTHVAALLDRLGVPNRVRAAVAAHRAGLV